MQRGTSPTRLQDRRSGEHGRHASPMGRRSPVVEIQCRVRLIRRRWAPASAMHARRVCRTGGDAAVGKHEALDRFFARSPELFGISTYDGLILKVNAAWQHTLGYTAEELALTSFWDRVHPEARGVCRGAVRALVRTGAAAVAVRMPHKDGSDRCISWRVVTPRGGSSPPAATSPSGSGSKGCWRRPADSGRKALHPCPLGRGQPRHPARHDTPPRHGGLCGDPAPHGQAAVDLALAAEVGGPPLRRRS